MIFLLIVLVSSLSLYICFTLYFWIGLKRLKPNQNIRKHYPPVSVIVAARNEEFLLPRLLSTLVKQDYPVDKLEIIIADDRSTDKTWECITNYSNRFPHFSGIKITEQSKKMSPKKHALSRAIDLSSGEIIISTDADCFVSKTWVSSMVSSFKKSTGIVVGYSAIDRSQKSFLCHYQALDFLALMSANAGSLGWENAWSGSGQNLAFRRSAFDMISGFTPVSNQVSGDDMYLVQSISKKHGVIFNTSPEGFVKTSPVLSVKQYLNQRIRWASNARTLAKQNTFFLFFLFSAFLCNLSLLLGFFFTPILYYFPIFWGGKTFFDGLVIQAGSTKFNTPIKISTFIVWSLFQPVYIPFIGFSGLIGKFRWKT